MVEEDRSQGGVILLEFCPPGHRGRAGLRTRRASRDRSLHSAYRHGSSWYGPGDNLILEEVDAYARKQYDLAVAAMHMGPVLETGGK